MKPLILLGPTAVGKTKLAIQLAKELNGEIISADSMQVYRGLDIGTAKPTLAEQQGIPHHLIDLRNPDEAWTVSDFVNECGQRINKLKEKGKLPIIVGGTGLYLWSLLEGFSFPITPADKELRTRLEKESLSRLRDLLFAVDPVAAGKIHANDKKRIVRALEVHELTGKPISEIQKLRLPNYKLLTTNYLLLGLDLPREELYEKINQRVELMITQGLIEEVKGLLAKGYDKNLPSFQALGYKEAITYLDGRWTMDELTQELKKRTRHFARRQLTWFRRFPEVKWFAPTIDISAILDYIRKHAKDETTRD